MARFPAQHVAANIWTPSLHQTPTYSFSNSVLVARSDEFIMQFFSWHKQGSSPLLQSDHLSWQLPTSVLTDFHLVFCGVFIFKRGLVGFLWRILIKQRLAHPAFAFTAYLSAHCSFQSEKPYFQLRVDMPVCLKTAVWTAANFFFLLLSALGFGHFSGITARSEVAQFSFKTAFLIRYFSTICSGAW